jgi:uncharacterized protein YdaU (DUF1376 family)
MANSSHLWRAPNTRGQHPSQEALAVTNHSSGAGALKNPPSIQFYPRDYLADADVRMLNYAQRGIYMDLLCYCWERDGLPAEHKLLGKLLGLSAKECDRLLPEVMVLFTKSESGYHHERLLKQKELYAEKSAKASASALRRHHKIDANALPTHCEGNAIIAVADAVAEAVLLDGSGEKVQEGGCDCPEFELACQAEPEPAKSQKPAAEPEGFDEFYAAYPKHVGRRTAAKTWGKLKPSPELRARIMADVESRAATWDWQKQGGQFVPHPATYLNGKRWEDDLPNASANSATTHATASLAQASTVNPTLEFGDDLPAGLTFDQDAAKTWAKAMGVLAEQDPEDYETWLSPLRFIGTVGQEWAVSAPTSQLRNWVATNYRDAIESAAECPGLSFRLRFLVRPE